MGPLETIKKEPLIEQLQRTNLQHCEDHRLTKLSPLLYTIKEKWEEETGKIEMCLCCGSQQKTKSTLGLHIKNMKNVHNIMKNTIKDQSHAGKGIASLCT